MKPNAIFQSSLLLFFCFVFLNSGLKAQEAVLIDEVIDWQWQMPQWYGGNAFYWWHREDVNPDIIDFGEMSATDWTTPFNYWTGTFYLRFEVIDQPTTSPFSIQLGIWQDIARPGGWLETCSSLSNLSGGNGSSVQKSIGSPSNWWEIRSEEDVDFTRPEDFYRIGILLWKGNGACIPYGQTWSASSSQCADPVTESAKFFPMQARLTVVAVASGHTFSGWENYPGSGAPKAPTPTYSVDYPNELTNKVVPATDEYSYNSSMSGAVSGTGAKLTLVPGQDVYFRTKAAGEVLASNIQHLDVPSRSATPSFVYDPVNQRTSLTVSSAYEYSNSSDMSAATTGTGTYVSFATGATKYFRRKATSTAFKSNIQALTGTSTPPTGSPEFVILNQIIEWPNTTDDNGFYFFYHNSSMPTNWLSPYDFYHGQIYTRFEIISQASSEPLGLQFGIWQQIPLTTGTLYETMGPYNAMTGPGSVVTKNNSPSVWWKLDGEDLDWTKMDQVWHFGINPWKNTSVQIRSENAAAWAERFTYWYPMQVRATVIAVASGYTFSGWDNYITPGQVPSYQIDFTNERTTTAIPATDEYSYNQTNWTSGTNVNLPLQPGQNVYIRQKISPTLIQELTVPTRSSEPSFAVDFITEKTTTSLSSEYQYATNSNMTSATSGTGQPVSLTPGTDLYIRKSATATAFASAIQTLDVPGRPAKPQIGINYISETTGLVGTEYIYSTQSNMSGSNPGTGVALPLAPGNTLYIQKPATASAFKSEIQQLVAPARPAAPSFEVDFAYETTNKAVNSSYLISEKADMSGSYSGNGSKLTLSAGTDLYIRQKGTDSQYASSILHLDVPARPVITVTLTNPVTVTHVPVTIQFPAAVTGFTAEDLQVVNGTIESVTGTYTANIIPTAVGLVRISMPANVVPEGNFAAFTTSFNYQLPTGINDDKAVKFEVYPTVVKDYLQIRYVSSLENTDYEIIDFRGVVVLKGKIADSGNSIMVSELTDGLYMIRFKLDSTYSEPFRFIKE